MTTEDTNHIDLSASKPVDATPPGLGDQAQTPPTPETPETPETSETPEVSEAPETPETPETPEVNPEASGPVLDGRPDERTDLISSGDEPITQQGMDWFVLRVASNKESSVRDTLLRKIEIEGMQHLIGRILVPTEKTKVIKGGKQRITETKLYPGYVFVEMRLEDDGRIPQDVFFLVKETTGVGDFVGTAGRPVAMAPHEVEKMLLDSKRPDEDPVIRLSFEKGEEVTIKEGPFEGYEGVVDELLPDKGLVRVLVTIFGRQAPIELEEWQVAKIDEDI